MHDVVILIPTYNPNEKLLKLVSELIKNNFSKVIIVNDGSTNNLEIFEKLKTINECILLEYKTNKGKGYALKYGIKYYLDNLKEFKGIITVDCDYQHIPYDIENISSKLLSNLDKVILGSRDFNKKQVPILNRLGNKFTSFVFELLYKTKINDTQTCLRGISNKYLPLCLETEGARFEFEMNMLINFSKEHIKFLEIPIETIYHTKGESKFHKIIDSIKVYKVLFIKYLK